MSLTIQQILQDAKKLSSKLKEHDTAADEILSQTQSVYKKLDAMKQYKDEVGELNEAARQRPHSMLIAGIQQENRHLRELQQENRELRAALEEHQNALELIMSKYRQHMSHLIKMSKHDFKALYSEQYTQVIEKQADKIADMAAVMKMAVQIDDQSDLKDDAILVQLANENMGLRELLQISVQYGSAKERTEEELKEQEANKKKDVEKEHVVKEGFRDPFEGINENVQKLNKDVEDNGVKIEGESSN